MVQLNQRFGQKKNFFNFPRFPLIFFFGCCSWYSLLREQNNMHPPRRGGEGGQSNIMEPRIRVNILEKGRILNIGRRQRFRQDG